MDHETEVIICCQNRHTDVVLHLSFASMRHVPLPFTVWQSCALQLYLICA